MGVCNCSLVCCTLLYVHSSIAIILMGKTELVALLNLPSWCLVKVEWLFLVVPWGCLWFVILVFPDHTHLLFYEMSIVDRHRCHMAAKFEVLVAEDHSKLPTLYWLPELHKRPYKSRFIANSSSCTTTELSILFIHCD